MSDASNTFTARILVGKTISTVAQDCAEIILYFSDGSIGRISAEGGLGCDEEIVYLSCNVTEAEAGGKDPWIFIKDRLPPDDTDCELLFEDGSTGFGFYCGNDPVAPIEGWMMDDFNPNLHHGNIVKWRKKP